MWKILVMVAVLCLPLVAAGEVRLDNYKTELERAPTLLSVEERKALLTDAENLHASLVRESRKTNEDATKAWCEAEVAKIDSEQKAIARKRIVDIHTETPADPVAKSALTEATRLRDEADAVYVAKVRIAQGYDTRAVAQRDTAEDIAVSLAIARHRINNPPSTPVFPTPRGGPPLPSSDPEVSTLRDEIREHKAYVDGRFRAVDERNNRMESNITALQADVRTLQQSHAQLASDFRGFAVNSESDAKLITDLLNKTRDDLASLRKRFDESDAAFLKRIKEVEKQIACLQSLKVTYYYVPQPAAPIYYIHPNYCGRYYYR